MHRGGRGALLLLYVDFLPCCTWEFSVPLVLAWFNQHGYISSHAMNNKATIIL